MKKFQGFVASKFSQLILESPQRTLQQKEQAQQYNQQLQHRIADYFRRKRAQEQAQAASGGAGSSSGSETSRSYMPADFEKASAELEQRYVKYMGTLIMCL